MNDLADIVIVGSGPAGAAIAETVLTTKSADKASPSVIMLEAGPSVLMQDKRKWWDHVLRKETPYDECEDKVDEYKSIGDTPMDLKGSRLFAKGGASLHWGAWMPRFQPEDFALKYSAGVGMDWPLTYDDIEPFYNAAEKFLQVVGDSSDKKRPRRSADFQFEAPPFNVSDGIVIKALDALGYSHTHIPVCRNTKEILYGKDGGVPKPEDISRKCETYGTCKYCPIGARYSSDQTIDRLLRWYPNNFELRLGAAVRRVLMSDTKNARGIEYFDTASNQIKKVEAKKIVITAGAIESPKILLASQDANWPLGLGNKFGHVGRHIIAHPLLKANGIRSTNSEKAFNEINFPTLGSRHFDSTKEQPKGKFFIIREHEKPTVPFEQMMSKGQSLRTLGDALDGEQTFELQGFIEEFEHPRSRVGLARGITRFGTYRTEIEFYQHSVTTTSINRHLGTLKGILEKMSCDSIKTSVLPRRADHLMSSCRMTKNAGDGVVDENLRVHDTDNVYVCSNAVFTSGAAANPSLTLVALAIRLGKHLFP